MSTQSTQLKAEVATLQKELAELANAQAEMEAGVKGVKLALKILRDYYASEGKAHEAAEGAGSTIIGLLEVAESDFTTGLSEMIATEEAAAADYDKQTKANAIEKATKDQDVKYKSKEAHELDEAVAEATSDRSGVQVELDAVNEYLEKLVDDCVAKPETYAERKARREAEIAGLKEALSILGGEAVLLQTGTALRGTRSNVE